MHHHIDFELIPEAVKTVLAEGSMSESELADRCGVSQPALNKIVRGEGQPSLTTLKKLWPVIGQHLMRLSGKPA